MATRSKGWKYIPTTRVAWEEPEKISPAPAKKACGPCYALCKTPGTHAEFFWESHRQPGLRVCHVCNWEVAFGSGEPPDIRNYPKRKRLPIVEALAERGIIVVYDPNGDSDPVQ